MCTVLAREQLGSREPLGGKGDQIIRTAKTLFSSLSRKIMQECASDGQVATCGGERKCFLMSLVWSLG